MRTEAMRAMVNKRLPAQASDQTAPRAPLNTVRQVSHNFHYFCCTSMNKRMQKERQAHSEEPPLRMKKQRENHGCLPNGRRLRTQIVRRRESCGLRSRDLCAAASLVQSIPSSRRMSWKGMKMAEDGGERQAAADQV